MSARSQSSTNFGAGTLSAKHQHIRARLDLQPEARAALKQELIQPAQRHGEAVVSFGYLKGCLSIGTDLHRLTDNSKITNLAAVAKQHNTNSADKR